MKLEHKMDGCLVFWRNPRIERWDLVANFGTEIAAKKALEFYNAHDFQGW